MIPPEEALGSRDLTSTTMADLPIDDLNVSSNETLITPAQLKREIPLTEAAQRTVANGRQVVRDILDGKDHRLFVVVGPCSIHDIKAAHEYAERLKVLAAEVSDSLFLVMRVYFEKPRTTVGWKGLINDPYLDDSFKIQDGLHIGRQLLLANRHADRVVVGLAIAATQHDMAVGVALGGDDGDAAFLVDAKEAVRAGNRLQGVDRHGQAAVGAVLEAYG